MTKTEPVITVELTDVTAKEDSTPSITGNSTFANVSLLNNDDNILSDYMTLEWNQAVLDGSMQHLPDNLSSVGFPVFSNDMSGDDRETNDIWQFQSVFSNSHSSAGISFEFLTDFPEKILVTWYGKDGNILSNGTFYPDSLNYACENKVENYYKVVAKFEKTTVPYRYLKIANVKYGYDILFRSENIIKATILEEVDPLSAELRINTLNFTVHDPSMDFNILNQKGKYSLFQSRQRIKAKEIVNGSPLEMGTFYLEDKESNSETEISFRAIDAIGIIDKTKFLKGRIYQDEKVSVIVSEIMQSAGWDRYEISEELKDITLNGYIPVCTHREALQQVAFAIRAVVDCSRSEKIRIYRQNMTSDIKLKEDRVFLSGEKITAKEYVSKVEITMHQYEKSGESTTLFNGILSPGLNEIVFSNPSYDISSDIGTIIESGVNYAIIQMAEYGNCIITGGAYHDMQSTFTRSIDIPEVNEIDNTISVKNATLVDKNNSYLLAERLMDYYSMRREINLRYVLDGEHTGRWVSVKSYQGMYINGAIESQEIDLAGGFISSSKIVGYNTLEMDFIYTGQEAYTGEKIGVV